MRQSRIWINRNTLTIKESLKSMWCIPAAKLTQEMARFRMRDLLDLELDQDGCNSSRNNPDKSSFVGFAKLVVWDLCQLWPNLWEILGFKTPPLGRFGTNLAGRSPQSSRLEQHTRSSFVRWHKNLSTIAGTLFHCSHKGHIAPWMDQVEMKVPQTREKWNKRNPRRNVNQVRLERGWTS